MQIYLIKNTRNGKCYVGQTIWDFNTRYPHGDWVARTSNKHLKSAGHKYGETSFEIKILWEGTCSRSELDVLEDKFMKEFNSLWPNGYNYKEAGRTGRHHHYFREYELIDASGKCYRVANLHQFCKGLGLNYGAMLNMVSGINTSSQGFALSGTPLDSIIDPEQKWEIENVHTKEQISLTRKEVANIAKKIGVSRNVFWRLLNGETILSKGWKLTSTKLCTKRLINNERQKNGVQLIHSSGEKAVVYSIYAFAKERGIDRQRFYDLIKGKAVTCQGWRLSNTEDPKEELYKRIGKEIDLYNWITNECIHVKNLSLFCRERKLHLGNMGIMVGGYIKQFAGWTVKGRDLSGYVPPKQLCFIEMKHEDGTVISGSNSKDIARKHKICSSGTISQMVSGKIKNYVRGWHVSRARFQFDYYPELIY